MDAVPLVISKGAGVEMRNGVGVAEWTHRFESGGELV